MENPTLERLEALSSRLEFIEKLLDERYEIIREQGERETV